MLPLGYGIPLKVSDMSQLGPPRPIPLDISVDQDNHTANLVGDSPNETLARNVADIELLIRDGKLNKQKDRHKECLKRLIRDCFNLSDKDLARFYNDPEKRKALYHIIIQKSRKTVWWLFGTNLVLISTITTLALTVHPTIFIFLVLLMANFPLLDPDCSPTGRKIYFLRTRKNILALEEKTGKENQAE